MEIKPNCLDFHSGGGEIDPYDAKVSEKCLCFHHNYTALIRQMFNTALVMTNTQSFNSKSTNGYGKPGSKYPKYKQGVFNPNLMRVNREYSFRSEYVCTRKNPKSSTSSLTGQSMVLVSDGNSEIGVHVRRNICYLICLRHLIRPRAVTNRIYILRKDLFHFMRVQHVLSYNLFNIMLSILL